MEQDDLKNTDVEKQKVEEPKGPDRNWKVWYWDQDDKQHTMYFKAPDERTAVEWCNAKFPGWNWTLFNDKGKNCNNNGVSVKL